MYVPSAITAHASAVVPSRMRRSVRSSPELGGRAIDTGALGAISIGADAMPGPARYFTLSSALRSAATTLAGSGTYPSDSLIVCPSFRQYFTMSLMASAVAGESYFL